MMLGSAVRILLARYHRTTYCMFGLYLARRRYIILHSRANDQRIAKRRNSKHTHPEGWSSFACTCTPSCRDWFELRLFKRTCPSELSTDCLLNTSGWRQCNLNLSSYDECRSTNLGYMECAVNGLRLQDGSSKGDGYFWIIKYETASWDLAFFVHSRPISETKSTTTVRRFGEWS